MNTVTVRIRGGLGNQMFQYAFGIHLARKLPATLLLDLEALFTQAPRIGALPRSFELDMFSITARLTFLSRLGLFLQHRSPRLVRFLFALKRRLALGADAAQDITEESFAALASSGRSFPTHPRVTGFWQSETYFADVADTVRREFSFRNPVKPALAPVLEQIRSSDSVCVHVRRGDNVHNPKSASTFVVLGSDYYERAYREFRTRIPDATFFIFSDDIEWCREALAFMDNAVFVSSRDNEADPSDDFRLMTQCKHFIIANSTLSWWAAWLGQHPAKTVLAPRRWLLDEAANERYRTSIIIGGWLVRD